MNDNNLVEHNMTVIDNAYKNVRMGSYAIDCIIEKIKNHNLEQILFRLNKRIRACF